jgi:hypothetical protein
MVCELLSVLAVFDPAVIFSSAASNLWPWPCDSRHLAILTFASMLFGFGIIFFFVGYFNALLLCTAVMFYDP